VASSRSSAHPFVYADCPVCDRQLPRIMVDVDAWSVRVPGQPSSRRQVLQLSVRAQELDAAWWAAARAEHPECIPSDVGVPAVGA